MQWAKLPEALVEEWGYFNYGLLQQPNQQINRIPGFPARNRYKVSPKAGFSYFRYAGVRSREINRFYHKCKTESVLLQPVLYSDRPGDLPDLQKPEPESKADYGSRKSKRPCCI